MKQKNKALIIFIVLILITTLACNISIEGAAPEGANLELTVTAQALLLQQPAQNSAPAVIAENPTATFTLAAEATPTTGGSGIIAATPTSISSTVTVTVSAETNCRTGPSTSFSSNYSLPVGQVAEVIGKNTLTNYWIIKIPGNGSGKTCWLWGKYATVNGNTNGLAEIATPAPPPTATATKTSTPTSTVTIAAPILNPPSSPSNIKTTTSCTDLGNGKYSYDGTVLWSDNSSNEAGFRINIFDATLSVVEVGPDIHGYNYSISSSQSAITLSVEAFNNAGSSQSIATSIHCP